MHTGYLYASLPQPHLPQHYSSHPSPKGETAFSPGRQPWAMRHKNLLRDGARQGERSAAELLSRQAANQKLKKFGRIHVHRHFGVGHVFFAHHRRRAGSGQRGR
jgi:hypothetical protein